MFVCVRASVLMSEREARAAATTGVRDSRFKDTKSSTEGGGFLKKEEEAASTKNWSSNHLSKNQRMNQFLKLRKARDSF